MLFFQWSKLLNSGRDRVSVRNGSVRETSVLVLPQRITSNLCLGPTLPTIHSAIGCGLICNVPHPSTGRLTGSIDMADGIVCVKHITKKPSLLGRETARLRWSPAVRAVIAAGFKAGLDEAQCLTACGGRRWRDAQETNNSRVLERKGEAHVYCLSKKVENIFVFCKEHSSFFL